MARENKQMRSTHASEVKPMALDMGLEKGQCGGWTGFLAHAVGRTVVPFAELGL